MVGTDRISRHLMLSSIAEVVALRSTCSKAQVGCIISWEGRVMSMGYNGAPAGMPHCDHTCDCDQHPVLLTEPVMTGHHPDCAAQRPCTTAIHAEANAIADAAREGRCTDGATLHCTWSPCLPCAQLIVSAGIKFVFWQNRYRDDLGLTFLEAAGIPAQQWDE